MFAEISLLPDIKNSFRSVALTMFLMQQQFRSQVVWCTQDTVVTGGLASSNRLRCAIWCVIRSKGSCYNRATLSGKKMKP